MVVVVVVVVVIEGERGSRYLWRRRYLNSGSTGVRPAPVPVSFRTSLAGVSVSFCGRIVFRPETSSPISCGCTRERRVSANTRNDTSSLSSQRQRAVPTDPHF